MPIFQVQATEPAPELRAFRCDPLSQICVWTDGEELHALAARDEFAASTAMSLGAGSDLVASELDAGIARLRERYKAIHRTLKRSWSIPANLIVSDTIHANLLTLSMAAQQTATGWTNTINARLRADDSSRQNAFMAATFPIASLLSYNALAIGGLTLPVLALSVPVGVLAQNIVFQLLVRYGLPAFLSSSGYLWTDIPSVMAASIHDIQSDKLRTEISAVSRILLAQTALHYLMSADGQRQLARDTRDQDAQYRRLTELTGTPLSLGQAISTFSDNRDFRLAFAAKVAPAIGPSYSEELNNFIVTGYFSKLNWVSCTISSSGTTRFHLSGTT